VDGLEPPATGSGARISVGHPGRRHQSEVEPLDSLGALLPILLIGVIFYLLILRPSRNRQKQQQQLLNELTPGAQIMTTAGIFGTVTSVEDDEVTVEVAPGVVLRMVKAAVGRVVEPVAQVDDRPLDDRLEGRAEPGDSPEKDS